MITFKQFLEESRSAPLYHATSLERAEKIVFSGILKTGIFNEPGVNKPTISLTRNLTFARSWLQEIGKFKHNQGFIFQFDQRKLTSRYKISPYNYFGIGSAASAKARDTPIENRFSKKGMDFNFINQFEEVILVDIKDPMKYVTRVYVDYERPPFMREYPNIPVYSYVDNKRID